MKRHELYSTYHEVHLRNTLSLSLSLSASYMYTLNSVQTKHEIYKSSETSYTFYMKHHELYSTYHEVHLRNTFSLSLSATYMYNLNSIQT